MKPIFYFYLFGLLATLSGCAAALIPATSDPYKKLEQAYYLLHNKRPIPAETIAREAMTRFTEEDNTDGIAETYLFLGQLYKHPNYRASAAYFKRINDYDETNQRSVENHQQAVTAFRKNNDYSGVAKAKFGLANAYAETDNQRQCSLYDESLKDYAVGLKQNPAKPLTINPSFDSFEQMVRAFKDKFCP